MSKKHLIIKDADEDIEYDVEEVSEGEEEVPAEDPIPEEHKEEVCPECGKDPCECESAPEAVVFTEEEIAALKELISIVPELKKLLEAKPEEKPAEEKVEEQEEIKEIEEVEETEEDESEKESEEDEDESEDEEEDEESEEESADSVTDSVGSLEQTVGDGKAEELNSAEATMAERFKKYYGGN